MLDPNLRPEKQHAMPQKGITEEPCIGQGRAGLRRKPEPDCINWPSDVTKRILERSKIVTGTTNSSQHTSSMHDRGIMINHFHQMFYCTQIHFINLYQSSKMQSAQLTKNSPYQESVISKAIQRPDESFFQNLERLEDLIDMGDLIHKFLPKQTDID